MFERLSPTVRCCIDSQKWRVLLRPRLPGRREHLSRTVPRIMTKTLPVLACVVIPVDCMSSEDPYMEQYAAWHMYKGGPNVVTGATTLTRSTMIKF